MKLPPEKEIVVEEKKRKLKLYCGSIWFITPERFLAIVKPFLSKEEYSKMEKVVEKMVEEAKTNSVSNKVSRYNIRRLLKKVVKDREKRYFLEELLGSLCKIETYYEDEEGRLYPLDYPSEIVLSR